MGCTLFDSLWANANCTQRSSVDCVEIHERVIQLSIYNEVNMHNCGLYASQGILICVFGKSL